jgi:hypothetical protein
VEAERLLEGARREAERVEAERQEAERLKAEAQRLKEEAKRLKAEERAARRSAGQKPSEPAEHSSWIGRAIDALRTDIQRLHKHQAATPEPIEPPEPVQAPTPQRSQAPKPSRKPKPPSPEQDEWGLYDPAQCGFDALYAKLEQAENQPEVEADETQDFDLAPTLALEPVVDAADWIDISLSDFQPSQPLHQTPTLPMPTRPSGLAPLAMWAHADSGASVEIIPRPQDELVDIMSRLHLPSSVAAVSYPRGCRIRRVRVTPQKASRNSKAKSDEPVVIVSRKRLQELREEAEEAALSASRQR